jgi:GntR family transcriptional regulator, transcriptional repressor for pyruvate dehydrogenase complex
MTEVDSSRLGVTPRLNPHASSRASTDMVEQITEAFFAGMHPGDWIGTETDLAEAFGVSRITARDATRVLEARGLVEVKVGARGGLRVAKPDPDRVIAALGVQLHLLGVTDRELLEARLAMEPAAAALAASEATDDEIEELKVLVKQSRTFGSRSASFREFVTSSTQFHSLIAMASHNRALSASIVAMHNDVVAVWMTRSKRDKINRVVKMHEDILDAVIQGDGRQARALMAEHLGELLAGVADEGPATRHQTPRPRAHKLPG